MSMAMKNWLKNLAADQVRLEIFAHTGRAMEYEELIKRKFRVQESDGLDIHVNHDWLFQHQRDLVNWALRRGRAAIFADTGLGKSRMQIAWANEVHIRTGRDVLILAPLAVATQTQEEADGVGIKITHALDGADIHPGLNITNYDRLHRFDADRFGAVVLDESSIIKHHTAKTLKTLLEAFEHTPYKLCATATPSPNDWTELGTHAEFLGIRSRSEMLAEFFVHDAANTQEWRLKGHARQAFWRWVSSWGAMVRSPADLGHDASAYKLPPLEVFQHVIKCSTPQFGQLFVTEAQTLMERRDARRESIAERVRACADVVNSDRQPWVVWCDLNAEGDALAAAIPDAIQISGSDDSDVKERRLHDFAHGKHRVLISKPSICGFGLNWQHASRMAFVGVTDSFEAYYQAVRRCWRFGQTKPVHVHIFASESEGAVVQNLKRKESSAKEMADQLSKETLEAVRSAVLGSVRESNPYEPALAMTIPSFLEAA